MGQTQGPLPAPLLVLDADKGIEQMLETYEQFTDEIRGRKPYSTPAKKPLGQGSAPLADSTNLPKTPVKS